MHTALLTVHIATGTLGLLSGIAALVFRKGAGAHRAAGKIFVLAMLLMGVSAAALAAMTSQPGMVVGGIATVYFIATAWMAARRKDGETGVFEIGAFVAAIAFAIALFMGARLTASGAVKTDNPYLAFAQYTLSGVFALAALGDLSVILRRGIAGAQRIARHLWRMCLGLIIAVGSFSAQGARMLPRGVGAKMLLASMIIVLAVMLYWLVRVLFTKWYARAEQTPQI